MIAEILNIALFRRAHKLPALRLGEVIHEEVFVVFNGFGFGRAERVGCT